MINRHCISLSSALYDLFPEIKEKLASRCPFQVDTYGSANKHEDKRSSVTELKLLSLSCTG